MPDLLRAESAGGQPCLMLIDTPAHLEVAAKLSQPNDLVVLTPLFNGNPNEDASAAVSSICHRHPSLGDSMRQVRGDDVRTGKLLDDIECLSTEALCTLLVSTRKILQFAPSA